MQAFFLLHQNQAIYVLVLEMQLLAQGSATNGDQNTLRIGLGTGSGNAQLDKAFIAGIRGITTTAADAIAVLISSTGQLGTASSSIRFKDNIADMAQDSEVLYALRPVTFNYKSRDVSERSPGLIAEEVETVAPWLVAYDQRGNTESVKVS